LDDGRVQIIAYGTVTKIKGDNVWVDNKHKGEDAMYAAFAWPETEETKAHLEFEIALAARHKKERDEQFVKTIKLANKYNRQIEQ
jgi:hypothetical protein